MGRPCDFCGRAPPPEGDPARAPWVWIEASRADAEVGLWLCSTSCVRALGSQVSHLLDEAASAAGRLAVGMSAPLDPRPVLTIVKGGGGG